VLFKIQRGTNQGVLFATDYETQSALIPITVSPTKGIILDTARMSQDVYSGRPTNVMTLINPLRNECYQVPLKTSFDLGYPLTVRKYAIGVPGSTTLTLKRSLVPVAIGSFQIAKSTVPSPFVIAFHEQGVTNMRSNPTVVVNGIYLQPKIVGAFYDYKNGGNVAYAVSRHDDVIELLQVTIKEEFLSKSVLTFGTLCRVGTVLTSQEKRSIYIMCIEANSYVLQINVDTKQVSSIQVSFESFDTSVGYIDPNEKNIYFVNSMYAYFY
jgi:hypothetical protein